MNDFVQITFLTTQPEQRELLIAYLSEAGYTGFEESEKELKAFIPGENFDKLFLHELSHKYQLSFKEDRIPSQNWNALWESNFQPVIVEDFVAIRASFHAPVAGVKQEIVITPKMSFGTGHHATTYMMMKQMRRIDFKNKVVLDFGTGTGVLAILAEKLGATRIVAVDNDDWSIENATENIHHNNSRHIEIIKAESINGLGNFDIILANINRNVILDNLPDLSNQLNKKGTLLLSGILKEDKYEILNSSARYDLELQHEEVLNNWLSLNLS
jgi:ribosomal protein L11 methyltransferase